MLKTIRLEVYLKPNPVLHVGLDTGGHSLFVHDEHGKCQKWVVSGTVRALTPQLNGLVLAIVEDRDLDAQVKTLRHR